MEKVKVFIVKIYLHLKLLRYLVRTTSLGSIALDKIVYHHLCSLRQQKEFKKRQLQIGCLAKLKL